MVLHPRDLKIDSIFLDRVNHEGTHLTRREGELGASFSITMHMPSISSFHARLLSFSPFCSFSPPEAWSIGAPTCSCAFGLPSYNSAHHPRFQGRELRHRLIHQSFVSDLAATNVLVIHCVTSFEGYDTNPGFQLYLTRKVHKWSSAGVEDVTAARYPPDGCRNRPPATTSKY